MATVKKGDTLVLVGTRKGLFLFHSRDRKRWSSRGPYFEGDTIRHAILDPDDGKTVFAGVTSEHWGPVVARSTDFGAKWTIPKEGPRFSKESGISVTKLWQLQKGPEGDLCAGVEPAGLFRSEDDGATWSSDDGLNYRVGRDKWEPGAAVCAFTQSSRTPAIPSACWSASRRRASSRRRTQANPGPCTMPGSAGTGSRRSTTEKTSARASTRWSGTRRTRPSCTSKITLACTGARGETLRGRSSRLACPFPRARGPPSGSRSRPIRTIARLRMPCPWWATTTA